MQKEIESEDNIYLFLQRTGRGYAGINFREKSQIFSRSEYHIHYQWEVKEVKQPALNYDFFFPTKNAEECDKRSGS